jgi:hypothetical protein
MSVELLRKCLNLRESIEAVAEEIRSLGWDDCGQLPEIERLQKLEKKLFKKINKFEEE